MTASLQLYCICCNVWFFPFYTTYWLGKGMGQEVAAGRDVFGRFNYQYGLGIDHLQLLSVNKWCGFRTGLLSTATSLFISAAQCLLLALNIICCMLPCLYWASVIPVPCTDHILWDLTPRENSHLQVYLPLERSDSTSQLPVSFSALYSWHPRQFVAWPDPQHLSTGTDREKSEYIFPSIVP